MGGGGGCQIGKSIRRNFLEPRSSEKNFSGLEGVRGMLPQKCLKDSVQDWLKSHSWTLVTYTDSLVAVVLVVCI